MNLSKKISDIKFTKTEFLIYNELKKGLTVSEIAVKLDRSIHTINNHKKNIFKKLSIHKISALLLF